MSKRFPLPPRRQPAPKTSQRDPDALAPITAALMRSAADICEAAATQWRAQADRLERLEGLIAESSTWRADGAPPPDAIHEREAALRLRVEAVAAATIVAQALAAFIHTAAE